MKVKDLIEKLKDMPECLEVLVEGRIAEDAAVDFARATVNLKAGKIKVMAADRTVNICGLPHTIIEADDPFDMDCHMGQINYKDLTIKINKNMPDIAKLETICHEMVHGMLVHTGHVDLSNDEQLVQALGSAIFQGFDVKIGLK